jgi:dihydroneopterin aldolase
LRIWIHLGCSDEEKFYPQLISFNINLDFNSPPKGVSTDSLEDTICYLRLVEAIKAYCKNKRFNLIECLTESIYKLIEQLLLPHYNLIASIKIITHKVSPPVEDVYGGVVFTYCVNSEERGNV